MNDREAPFDISDMREVMQELPLFKAFAFRGVSWVEVEWDRREAARRAALPPGNRHERRKAAKLARRK